MLDPTTHALYAAAENPALRAEAVRDSLGSGTLTVELRDGETLVYSGAFDGPMTADEDGSLWADALLDAPVTVAGEPDVATWTCCISGEEGAYIIGSFGPGGRFWSGPLSVGQAVRLVVRITAPDEGLPSGGGDPLTFAIPEEIGISAGDSHDLVMYVSGGTPPYGGYRVGTGELPAGVTLSSDGLLEASAETDATISGDITFDVEDQYVAPLPPGELPQFRLTSAVGGSNLPFAFGHVFAQGDVPSGQHLDSDLADWQSTPTTYWPDGSLRHAIIAGRADCITGEPTVIQLASSPAPRSGAALTLADLKAAVSSIALELPALHDWSFAVEPRTVGATLNMSANADIYEDASVTANNGAATSDFVSVPTGTRGRTITATLSGGTLDGLQTATVTLRYHRVRSIVSIERGVNPRINYASGGGGSIGVAVGNTVAFADIVGMTELNGLTATVTAAKATGGELWFEIDLDTSEFGEYVSGGTATRQELTATSETTIARVRSGGGLSWNGSANSYDNVAPLATTTMLSGSDFDTPQRVVASGPVMSSWLFRKPISAAAPWSHLVLWADVRLYQGGRVEVFPWAENAFLLAATPRAFRGQMRVKVNGSTTFDQTVEIKHHTRIPLIDNSATAFRHWSYWVGGDPQIEPGHDVAYLMRSRMVPNYGWTTKESSLAALTQAYTPSWRGNVPGAMGTAGFQGHIGVLPNWQAAYLSSGDPRAYRAVVANGLASGSWSISYRDDTTHEPIRFVDYPTAAIEFSGSPTIPSGSGGDNGTWDVAHQPSMDYLPWLLTGRWFHLDQMAFWTTRNYLYLSHVTRQGDKGIILGAAARARGWHLRTIAQLLASLPADHPCFASVQYQWESIIAAWEAHFIDGTTGDGKWANDLGLLCVYASGGESAYGKMANLWWGAPWMKAVQTLALGMAWDLDLPQSPASRISHERVRDFSYRLPVGFSGDGTPGSWNWRHFAAYKLPIGYDSVGLPLDGFHANWGECYSAYQQYGNTGTTAYPDPDPTDMTGVLHYDSRTVRAGDWGTLSGLSFMYSALTYAVSHGAPGAIEGWNRITGSASWALATPDYESTPAWALYPRNL